MTLLAVVGNGGAAHGWESARVDPEVDNLESLLRGCESRRAVVEAWLAHDAAAGPDVAAQTVTTGAVATEGPADDMLPCTAEAIVERLGARPPGVWAIAAAESGELFATVNLPLSGVLVSGDGGRSWRYRYLLVSGYNADGPTLLRGVDYRHGLLAVASENGILLSTDDGHSFTTALPGQPFTAVALSPHRAGWIVAGGDGTSATSTDGGATWTELGFAAFTRGLATRNRYLTDHVTSLAFDPVAGDTVYVGTGSHLYRLLADPAGAAPLRWQAMEGDARGRVHDDSTVYNVEIGTRFMISTCNGVYYLARPPAEAGAGDQAAVSWGKFRDRAFDRRGLDGPKGNLRSYFVTEDPANPDRVLVADYAGLYEGRGRSGAMHWRRVEELPYWSPERGYPEYTAIAWTRGGAAVVGSRYRGIFVDGASSGSEPATVSRLPPGPAYPVAASVGAAGGAAGGASR